MAKYYFVISALPSIQIGTKPEISFQKLHELIRENVTKEDYATFLEFLSPVDLYNIKALWLKVPLDERGTLPAKELEEALLVGSNFPGYVEDFLERYPSVEERVRFFSALISAFYRQKRRGFLESYFCMEREVRLVLLALRAKKYEKDVSKELQFEDPFDPWVMDILAQKDSGEYVPPAEYTDLRERFIAHSDQPYALALSIGEFRIARIEEIEEKEPFSIDALLGYAARLWIVENWARLNQEQGRVAIEGLSQYG